MGDLFLSGSSTRITVSAQRLARLQRLGRGSLAALLTLLALGTLFAGSSAAAPAPAPTVSIGGVSLAEGTGGTTAFEFTVALSAAASKSVSVDFATANGTAASPTDYAATSGKLTFASGDTAKTITVQVNGDAAAEADETFLVALSNPKAATIGDGQGLGTIVNDDTQPAQPSLAINDISLGEGNGGGTTNAVFTISLSAPAPASGVTFDIATANGSASSASDYTAKTVLGATIPPGASLYAFTVPVAADMTVEGPETFFANVSNVAGAAVLDGQGQATIVNDDAPPGGGTFPTLSIDDVTHVEGSSGTTEYMFTVTLAPASNSKVTVSFATQAGTASPNVDYQPASGTLTFKNGQTTRQITVRVSGDTSSEPDEMFFVRLANAVNATIGDGEGLGTIMDDDKDPPVANEQSVQVAEEAAVTITLTGSDPDGDPITFKISTLPTNGTLHEGSSVLGTPITTVPFTTSGTVTYAPGADYAGGDSFTFVTNDGEGDSTPATVSITVTNVNDVPTDVALSSSSVNETSASGTTVGTLSTTDADPSDTHTYALISGVGGADNASFTIDGISLKTAASFDYEDQSSYSILVETDDGNGGTFAKQFTITVNNVSEAPTDIALSSSTVDENEPSGTAVGTLSTTDADTGETHAYSLAAGTGDTDNASFTTVGDTLQTAAVFDFEVKSSYAIRVQTDDGNGGIFAKQFTITVNNVSEAPTDIALSSSTVNENEPSGTAVGTLSTTDADTGGTHAYSLVAGTGGTDNASFTIVGALLQTAAVFDFEVKSSYAIRVQTDDGNGGTFAKQFTVTVNDVNDAPVLDDIEAADLAYTAGDSATAITATLTVADQDDPQLEGATLSITAGHSTADDVLAFSDQNGITGNFNSATGELALAGTASLTDYQTALRSVTYATASATPSSAATRTISFEADDGTALSNIQSRDVDVSLPNQAPVAVDQIGGSAVAATEDGNAVTITLTATDAEDDNLTFEIVGSPTKGTLGTIGTPDCTTTANTCTATADYMPSADENGADSFTFKANDGTVDSNTATVEINITAVNDAPALANVEAGALAYTENASATAVTSSITVTDNDSTNSTGATVQITGNYVSGQDVLAFANTVDITGTFNAGTGTLTLSGSDTLADYQAALRAVTYANTSDAPSTATRTVSFQVDDGAAANNLSNTATRTIATTAVNDTPVNSVPGGQSVNEDTDLTFTGMSVADVDAGAGKRPGDRLRVERDDHPNRVGRDSRRLRNEQPEHHGHALSGQRSTERSQVQGRRQLQLNARDGDDHCLHQRPGQHGNRRRAQRRGHHRRDGQCGERPPDSGG